MLEGEGLVVSRPYCGRFVFQLREEEFEGLLLVRISLECIAATLAAYKITRDGAKRLREHTKPPSGPIRTFAELLSWEESIHYRIWEIANEPALTRHLKSVIYPFIMQSAHHWFPDGRSLEDRVKAIQDPQDPANHSALVEAICNRDVARARREVIRHLSRGPISKQCEALIATIFSGF